MKYPEEVQKYIDFVQSIGYKENQDLEKFNLIHLYPLKIAYPNGYFDSRFFLLKGYNFNKMQMKNLGEHDGIKMDKNVEVDIVRIFADGSTLIRFAHLIKASPYGEVEISRA